ncbi:MAG: sensor histidine kinase [Niabella sp.]
MFNKRVQIVLHIVAWILFVLMILAFVTSGRGASASFADRILSKPFFILIVIYPAIFYVNQIVLVPKLFIAKKYILYSLIIIGLLILVMYIKPFEQLLHNGEQPGIGGPPDIPDFQNRQEMPDMNGMPGAPPQQQRENTRFDIISTVLFIVTWAISTLLVLLQRWRITESNKAIIEIEKVNAELAFLKAQVSPHFLFNTLNNIYALTLAKSDKAPSSVLRLSNIMRYVTDDAGEAYVPIEKEIACVNDYIELQKLRLGKNVILQYELAGQYGDVTIAPLILIAFVENVFKHGISKRKDSLIIISINVNEKQIHLHTQNDIVKNNTVNEERTGVGLENVKKRLEHLYPMQYRLQITDDNKKFIVDLFLYQ